MTTTTLTTPTTAPPIAAEEETCGMCNGTRGTWETGDGASPGKSLRRWVPCVGCNGTGKVGK